MAFARFDCSAGPAYAQQVLTASSAFTIDATVNIPPATLAALLTGSGDGAGVVFLSLITGSNQDAIFPSHASSSWQWATYDDTTPQGAIAGGVDAVIQAVMTFTSGTTWSVVWKVGGTTLFTNSVDFGADDTQDFQLRVGGASADEDVGEIYDVLSVTVKDDTSAVVFSDDFASGDFSLWDSTTGDSTVFLVAPVEGAGGVRVSIAFDDATLEPNPVWTDVTALSPSIVASYEIDKSRDYELERTGNSSARVQLTDRSGILDPTNTMGAYYTKLEPDIQIKIELWNPIASEWQCRFRGFIEDFDFSLSDTQIVNRVAITCYDIFALLTSIEMLPGQFGDTPPAGSEATIFFDSTTSDQFKVRIEQVLAQATIDPAFYVVFSGNIHLLDAFYSPGTDAMSPIQETANAEFPGVSNIYPDRFGRLAAHGRLAEFDPTGTAATTTTDKWDFQHWKCGDGAAVAASPSDTAQIRPPFSWNRGRSKVINSALCYPADCAQAQIPNQVYVDPAIGSARIKSWSKEKLLVKDGILTGNSGNDECLAYATYIVTNYKDPRNRITVLTFRTADVNAVGAAATWNLLCKADISDLIDVTVTDPGGGGFNAEPFRIEGVKESAGPLNGEYANVTLSLDVVPVPLLIDTGGLDGT